MNPFESIYFFVGTVYPQVLHYNVFLFVNLFPSKMEDCISGIQKSSFINKIKTND